MIPVVRINGEDFIGTEYEEIVWDRIKAAKKACAKEFMICFHAPDTKKLAKIAAAANKHADTLQIKTTVKLWKNALKDSVFLDIFTVSKNLESRKFRFACTAQAPANVIMSMNFLIEHFRFLRAKSDDYRSSNPKRQKRNDGTDFDYNK